MLFVIPIDKDIYTYINILYYKKLLTTNSHKFESFFSLIKGYSRKGSALEFLERFEEAKMCYEAGLKIDPSNEQFKTGIEQCESHLTGETIYCYDISKQLSQLFTITCWVG